MYLSSFFFFFLLLRAKHVLKGFYQENVINSQLLAKPWSLSLYKTARSDALLQVQVSGLGPSAGLGLWCLCVGVVDLDVCVHACCSLPGPLAELCRGEPEEVSSSNR